MIKPKKRINPKESSYKFYHKELGYIIAIKSNNKKMSISYKDDILFYKYPKNTFNKEEFIKHIEKNYKTLINWKRKSSNKILIPTHSEDEVRSYKSICKQIVENFIENEANLKNIKNTYSKISIKNQSRIWGSCSSKKVLSFNYRIIFLPNELFAYVIYHELAHLKYMNHQKEYWTYLTSLLPQAKYLDKQLNSYIFYKDIEKYIDKNDRVEIIQLNT